MKKCNSCKKTKSKSEFGGRSGYQKGMLLAFCKSCMNERQRKWREANKERYNLYQENYHKAHLQK